MINVIVVMLFKSSFISSEELPEQSYPDHISQNIDIVYTLLHPL